MPNIYITVNNYKKDNNMKIYRTTDGWKSIKFGNRKSGRNKHAQ